MSRVLMGSLTVCIAMAFAGCGADNTSSMDKGYSESKPREALTGPEGAGGASEGPASSATAPPPEL